MPATTLGRLIPNGVDPDDLLSNPVVTGVRGDRFCLSYVGSFYGDRDGEPVFAAVRTLVDRGVIDPNRFEIRIVGRSVRHWDDEPVPAPVTFTGFVDHVQAVSEMHCSTVLFFHQPPHVPGASGKIYEYLTSRRPVLCAAHPDNVGYRLITELGAGECGDVRDPASVEAALERLVLRWKQGALAPLDYIRAEALARFSRAKLAGDLADVLEATIRDNAASPPPVPVVAD